MLHLSHLVSLRPVVDAANCSRQTYPACHATVTLFESVVAALDSISVENLKQAYCLNPRRVVLLATAANQTSQYCGCLTLHSNLLMRRRVLLFGYPVLSSCTNSMQTADAT